MLEKKIKEIRRSKILEIVQLRQVYKLDYTFHFGKVGCLMTVLIRTYLLNVLLTKISVQFQEKNLELAEIGEWYVVLLLIVSEICNSPLTLIASCLAVMALSNGVIRMTSAYLNSCKSHAPPSTAVLSGIKRKRDKHKTFSY